MNHKTTRKRVVLSSVVLAGALGLSACGSDEPSVSEATGAASDAATSSEETSEESPSSEETSQESPSSDDADDTDTADDADDADDKDDADDVADDGPTEPSAKDAKMKFGEPAVLEDDRLGTYRLTVDELEKAPDSIFDETRLNKSDGTVYFVKYSVTPIKAGSSSSFDPSRINGLFLHPTFEPPQKAKRMYGSVDDCETDRTKLEIGDEGEGCYIYQVSGKESKTVSYKTSQYNLLWQ